MKLVWSPETASKAYIDTVKYCELYTESGTAELMSAMAAGWNAGTIVEVWSSGGAAATSAGLAIAARHTRGRHVCVVPDERSRLEYTSALAAGAPPDSGSGAGISPEVLVGDPEEVMGELEGIDFLVVDGWRRDFSKVLRMARFSSRGAVLVCKNAEAKTASCGRWRAVVDGGRYRVVRTAFLPVGQGIDIAHVAAPGANDQRGVAGEKKKRRWIKHFDRSSGEEHVIRTT